MIGRKARTRSHVGRQPLYRIFFATDVHGSDVCFRKFLAAADVYNADALVLGGDLGGKGLVPAKRSRSGVELVLHGRTWTADATDRDELYERVRREGVYPVEIDDPDTLDRLESDPAYLAHRFREEIAAQVRGWCDMAAERLAERVRLVITPGNDDPRDVDEVLNVAARVECPEHAVTALGPIRLASMGEVPPTPWATERELPETQLSELIDEILADDPGEPPIAFNFHTPPYDSGLDMAPELDADLRPVIHGTQPGVVAVGSHAVRAAIKRYAPVVALHGHIHEGRGFRKIAETVCLNPGTEYSAGMLCGAIVDLDERGQLIDYLLTAG